MPTPGRPATAPVRPTPVPTAAASLSAHFFCALPHAQNILYNKMCCSAQPHFSSLIHFQALKKIARNKEILLLQFS